MCTTESLYYTAIIKYDIINQLYLDKLLKKKNTMRYHFTPVRMAIITKT